MRRGQAIQTVRPPEPAAGSRAPWWRRRAADLEGVLAIDGPSLAAFRAALGLVLCADLLMRSRHLFAHYTDAGVLPRAAVDDFLGPWDFSLHLAMGSPAWTIFLLLVALAAGAALAAGYRARLAAAVSWVLLVSLQNRNPLVVHSGDVILRMMLFWYCWIPDSRGKRVTGMAPAALLLQVGFVYWFAALNKTGLEWHGEGSAVWYALHVDQLATPLGRWAGGLPPALLKATTRAVWLWEWAGTFLLFAPAPYRWLRLVAILGFALMHLGFELLLGLGIFPFIDLVSLVPFLPAEYLPPLPRLPRLRVPRWRFPGWSRSAAVMALLGYVFLWNFVSLPQVDIQPPPALLAPGRVLHVDQHWSMFSPAPLREDGWYVLKGTLQNGRPADLLRGIEAEVSWEKPALVSATYPEERWQKYLMNLYHPSNEKFRPYYARYLCGAWNREALTGRKLKRVEVYFVHETTTLRGKATPRPELLTKHDCF